MNNYTCTKCLTHITNNGNPNSGNCPKGGMHRWSNDGEVGDTNYQCSKCKLILKSKQQPAFGNCEAGGGHRWYKL